MNIINILKFINHPRTVIIILLLFILFYFLYGGLIEGFGKNFLSFGPNQDTYGEYTYFMGIRLDTWHRVIMAYIIIFLTAVVQIYYYTSGEYLKGMFHTIPYIKTLSSNIYMLLDPLFNTILYIITFYATATFEIQYLLPQLLGTYFINIPYILLWFSNKSSSFYNIN